MSKTNENVNSVENLASKIETLVDRKGKSVKAIRLQHLQGAEAETEAGAAIKAKYPSADVARGVFILIQEKKRAVFNRCAHKGCKAELGLTRTSDLFQCSFCPEHAPVRKSKSGSTGRLLDQLAQLDS